MAKKRVHEIARQHDALVDAGVTEIIVDVDPSDPGLAATRSLLDGREAA